jgi:hypothetical protein
LIHTRSAGTSSWPALAHAALLGRAAIVVDEDGHAVDPGELALRLLELVAVAHAGDRVERDVAVALRLGRGHHDLLDALERQRARDRRHVEAPGRLLSAGHRDGVVVEQLVGDARAGGHRRADRQRPGVMERPVAQVLDEVLVVGERLQADPLRPLAAHLGHADELAPAIAAVDRDQRVAPDAGADELVGRRPRGDVVRTPRAEVRRAHRQRLVARGRLTALLDQLDPPASLLRQRVLADHQHQRARPRHRR